MNKYGWLRRSCWLAMIATAAAATAQFASAADDLTGLSWLVGVWQSAVIEGAQTEYAYLPLFNGEMLSTMYAVKDGKPTRYELRVIKAEGGQVMFHEMAFRPDLTLGTPTPVRPLESADADHINFTDMKVTRVGPDAIRLMLTFHPPGTAAVSRELDLHRVIRLARVRTKP